MIASVRNTRGAVLVEVLISLLIFTIGVTGSLSLLTTAAKANSISKNRTVALNLAAEALEAIKNVRDTNWMISSSNLRSCWNFLGDTDEDGAITAADDLCIPDDTGQNQHPLGVLTSGTRLRSFIVDFDAITSRWVVLPAPEYLDTSVSPNIFSKYSDTAERNGDADNVNSVGGRTTALGLSADGRYTHTGGTATPFIRIVSICYIDNILTGQNCTNSGLYPFGNKGRDNRIKVTTTVYWKDSPLETTYRSVVMETILTDYFEREEWSS
jgi:type II secretory pathway pseudopilin PulG